MATANGMTVKEVLLRHSGLLVGGAVAIFGTSLVVWGNGVGRQHTENIFDARMSILDMMN